MPTIWTNPNKSTTNWNSENKSTVDKAILTEDSFILLLENGDYLLQEDDFPDWIGGNKSLSNWASPLKN